ncbi:hypothetical protein M9H77_10477 [Catharanthus roseus]|uniref:Uncharacterized protein n=1 Tax=Catharanthus roseus TaxID=4058 RepID=A0ACC0BBV2_CATRO|nr:hypothetical protein M9H77_10477 [Catharanthus roseus]
MESNNNTKKTRSSSRLWTNERHFRFLNSIEASFVRALFEKNGGSFSSSSDDDDHLLLRLDRHVPDSSDSTQDLPQELRRRRYSTSDAEDPRIRVEKKNKRFQLPKDQVVPQQEKRSEERSDISINI